MNEIIEPQDFGVHSSWRLLQRCVEDGVQRITRCLPVRGRGVLMQTQTRIVTCDAEGKPTGFVDGSITLSDPYEIRDVIVVEWAESKASPIELAPGVPASTTIEIGHRELMSVKEAKEKFYPKGVNEKSLPESQRVTSGAVFTLDVTRSQNNAQKAA